MSESELNLESLVEFVKDIDIDTDIDFTDSKSWLILVEMEKIFHQKFAMFAKAFTNIEKMSIPINKDINNNLATVLRVGPSLKSLRFVVNEGNHKNAIEHIKDVNVGDFLTLLAEQSPYLVEFTIDPTWSDRDEFEKHLGVYITRLSGHCKIEQLVITYETDIINNLRLHDQVKDLTIKFPSRLPKFKYDQILSELSAYQAKERTGDIELIRLRFFIRVEDEIEFVINILEIFPTIKKIEMRPMTDTSQTITDPMHKLIHTLNNYKGLESIDIYWTNSVAILNLMNDRLIRCIMINPPNKTSFLGENDESMYLKTKPIVDSYIESIKSKSFSNLHYLSIGSQFRIFSDPEVFTNLKTVHIFGSMPPSIKSKGLVPSMHHKDALVYLVHMDEWFNTFVMMRGHIIKSLVGIAYDYEASIALDVIGTFCPNLEAASIIISGQRNIMPKTSTLKRLDSINPNHLGVIVVILTTSLRCKKLYREAYEKIDKKEGKLKILMHDYVDDQ